MVYRTPFFLPLLYPNLTWRIPTKEKSICLTFDDGPVPGPTDFVLDILSRYNLKATFFCIGDNVRKHPDIFRRIVNEGHIVGNHTYNHSNGWNTTLEEYIENVHLCDTMVASYQLPVTGNTQPATGNYFRPPYGRITSKQINALKENYKIIMWDVLTQDYNQRITQQACLKGSIGATRKGSITVFHDSYKADRNLAFVLPRYIEHFLEKGYSFNAIPQ
ncbi:MAG: polysaccharide deacetylase family protein [Cyclobacteriaceae bacterium]|nr:polysaccharide deacetylase family protein [Cyclobacteriaceae bacterium]